MTTEELAMKAGFNKTILKIYEKQFEQLVRLVREENNNDSR